MQMAIGAGNALAEGSRLQLALAEGTLSFSNLQSAPAKTLQAKLSARTGVAEIQSG